jgi:multisubunit Na+/H+ antiporter MnhF subunit
VNAFVIAAIAMLIGMIPCLVVIWRDSELPALIGYEVISSIAVMVLVLLPVGFNRFGMMELPVLLALLLFGGGLVFVRVLERWL